MFINVELDICPAFGWSGGPTFNTRLVTTQAWIERRNANNIECRHSYTLPLQNITEDVYLDTLKQAFLACRGMLHSFKIKDRNDYEATNELFGEGDGATKVFQLYKISNFGAASYSRLINKPQPGATVAVNGVATAVTIDPLTGLVTFAAAPANGALLTWTGEFRVAVRFNSDVLNTTIDNKLGNGDFIINGSVDLIEVFDE